MPLHLLGKKSWNPYAPEAIARVRADEEAHESLHRDYADRIAQHEAARRLAQLRGQPFTARTPTPPPDRIDARSNQPNDRKRRADYDTKRRRGEDDTERDIRIAKSRAVEADQRGAARDAALRRADAQTPDIQDAQGHIQLFAEPAAKPRLGARENRREQAEQRRKEEAEGGMRFKNAAGYGESSSLGKQGPWYARSGYSGTEELDSATSERMIEEAEGRQRREEKRIASADPLAAMKSGVKKMKDREKVNEERREQMERFREEQERAFKREERIRKLKDRESRKDHGHRSRSPSRRDGKRSRSIDRHYRNREHGYRDDSRRSRHDHQRTEDRCADHSDRQHTSHSRRHTHREDHRLSPIT